jgi:hypothetical protein
MNPFSLARFPKKYKDNFAKKSVIIGSSVKVLSGFEYCSRGYHWSVSGDTMGRLFYHYKTNTLNAQQPGG